MTLVASVRAKWFKPNLGEYPAPTGASGAQRTKTSLDARQRQCCIYMRSGFRKIRNKPKMASHMGFPLRKNLLLESVVSLSLREPNAE